MLPFIMIKSIAPGEARTHGLQIMRLTRCLLRYGGSVTVESKTMRKLLPFFIWIVNGLLIVQLDSKNSKTNHKISFLVMRQPGIEPGSTAWKAAMLTTIPLTLSGGSSDPKVISHSCTTHAIKMSLPWPGFEPGLLRPQRRVLTTRRSRLDIENSAKWPIQFNVTSNVEFPYKVQNEYWFINSVSVV